MSKSESCDPKYVLQNLEVIKKRVDKLHYITDTLNRCAISDIPTTKKKRKMNGYNCFVRVSVKKGEAFMSVVKSGAWKQLSDKQKSTWKHLADEGCPPKLWNK